MRTLRQKSGRCKLPQLAARARTPQSSRPRRQRHFSRMTSMTTHDLCLLGSTMLCALFSLSPSRSRSFSRVSQTQRETDSRRAHPRIHTANLTVKCTKKFVFLLYFGYVLSRGVLRAHLNIGLRAPFCSFFFFYDRTRSAEHRRRETYIYNRNVPSTVWQT